MFCPLKEWLGLSIRLQRVQTPYWEQNGMVAAGPHQAKTLEELGKQLRTPVTILGIDYELSGWDIVQSNPETLRWVYCVVPPQKDQAVGNLEDQAEPLVPLVAYYSTSGMWQIIGVHTLPNFPDPSDMMIAWAQMESLKAVDAIQQGIKNYRRLRNLAKGQLEP